MNDEAAFVNHLAAHPDDGTARLAYVDWLDEHGRSIEAAWVREEGAPPPLMTRLHSYGDIYYGGVYCDNFSNDGRGDGRGAGTGFGGAEGGGDGNGTNSKSRSLGSIYGGGFGDGSGHCDGLVFLFDERARQGFAQGEGSGDGNGQGSIRFLYGRHEIKFEPSIKREKNHIPASGEYVIVRSLDQGCVCGEYRSHHGREVALGKARQIFFWTGERHTLINFAVAPERCRLSREAPGEVIVLEACGIIPATPEVEALLRTRPPEELS